ncbi:MAG: Peptidylprolyl isomerase [Candidatus Nomurabacteria bacterium GW2011_GWE1_32_28]|uniref:Peptidyl-prolyl cis-trans isomerase n=1 Tax=Candidatus Nomurabacteria bacterium GW2011_GWF1_31_48 TaxID=1618767 RepID=A0A0F9YW60_9BACT|nr:MAG: Peptidylprolyl isomerase [Candidatus Nomurabacteria bacterium GW2011_GWF2_30_133]KKP28963.1 MAG: Peptidylprolyl isomerase [Candidatus Nomurabacteria bacterium GW2011_GWE2_31_40]KKP30701.1 MAG: Peptidylprolyl isomerase [Candidatus Nomurabacteria bacterium GW2011_GWF1_31_48]KKP35219.1 MAG: Peptidylprolyl isomerase [Candidatus Nomurabacteria bacterium GW2011_GWE1_32_28]
MNKYGIIVLLIIVLGLGYWVSVGTKKDSTNSPTDEINLFGDDSKENVDQNQMQNEQAGEVNKEINNNQIENTKIMKAILHTNKGDITIQFNPSTPKTVENFIKLAREGFYDGTKFHRVIKDFMSQGGDPLSKDDLKKDSWGTGGPGYQFADEINDENSNEVGTISMANAGPNTNGSQFFINAADNNFLDTKHTVFGKVVDGLDVALAINSVKVDSSDKPLEPIVIESITVN